MILRSSFKYGKATVGRSKRSAKITEFSSSSGLVVVRRRHTSTLFSIFPILFTIGVCRVAGGSGLNVDVCGQSKPCEQSTEGRLEHIAPTAFSTVLMNGHSITSGQLRRRRRRSAHHGGLWREGIGRRDCRQSRSTEGGSCSNQRPLLHRLRLVAVAGDSHLVFFVANVDGTGICGKNSQWMGGNNGTIVHVASASVPARQRTTCGIRGAIHLQFQVGPYVHDDSID